MKRIITAMVISVSLMITTPAVAVPACANCFARPTISNGGLPYARNVRILRNGVYYICNAYLDPSNSSKTIYKDCRPVASDNATAWLTYPARWI